MTLTVSPMGNFPLGSYGLGLGGSFSSYDPYMQSMYGLGTMGTTGYGTMGSTYGINPMLGMYDPTYYTKLQQDMEKMGLTHAGAMHQMVLNNANKAHKETDESLISKMIHNGSIQHLIKNMHQQIIAGNHDGTCREYDQLEAQILARYSDEFKSMGNEINIKTSIRNIIANLYQEITNENLQANIEKYGESSFSNGFQQALHPGHNVRTINDTKQHVLGLDINNYQSEENHQTIGKWAGYGARVGRDMIGGAIGAAALTGAGIGGIKMLTPSPDSLLEEAYEKKAKDLGKAVDALTTAEKDAAKTALESTRSFKHAKWVKDIKWGKNLKKAGKWGLALGLVADAVWSLT